MITVITNKVGDRSVVTVDGEPDGVSRALRVRTLVYIKYT